MIAEKILPWYHVAYPLVVALGAIGLFFLTEYVNKSKDRELARFQTEARVQIKQAETKATEAEARAAEANLTLTRISQPRSISASDRQILVDALQQFSGQEYAFDVYQDEEAFSLLSQLDAALKQAGWRRVPVWDRMIVHTIAGERVGSTAISGIVIQASAAYERGVPVLLNLQNHLIGLGISGRANRVVNWNEEHLETIVIDVGRKPLGS